LLGPQLLHVAIPTTAGTGSEVSNCAVIKNNALGVKSYIVDRYLIPDIAILDPTLTVSLPPLLTTSTAFDALTHAIEAYTSKAANAMSDAQALHAIRLIMGNIQTVVEDGTNLSARSAMQTAATLAGWAMGNANVGLVHGMSHALGARHSVAHGTGNAILLPHVMRFNAELPAAALRLRDVAVALGIAEASAPLQAARAAADKVTELLAATRHPQRLSEVKVPKEDLEAMSEAAFIDLATLFNARSVMFPSQIAELYQQAY
jgi:alcohol dehydrogenase class IV